MNIYGGIEGGGTNSYLVLLDGDTGKKVGSAEGPGTNYHLIGLNKMFEIIASLVKEAKINANLDSEPPLSGLGLALGGAENEDENSRIVAEFQQKYPNLAKTVHLTTDSVGTICTSQENGGIVLIAGTGSSCRLLNPDGKIHCCGGWGHIIGDQGGAFWISNLAIRIIFDTEDGLQDLHSDLASDVSVEYVKNEMLKFFQIATKLDILEYLYQKFDKTELAKFCVVLAEGARKKDPICIYVFKKAGEMLGRHVIAVSRNMDESLFNPVPIVTVGSVWKSYDLMREGFTATLRSHFRARTKINLYRLSASPAIGAAVLAGKLNSHKIPVDFSKNAHLFETIEL